MSATFSNRLSQLGYVKTRRLLVLVGVLVMGVVAFTMYARRVDTVEVVATLLFFPIFIAFVYRGVIGGVIAALAATGVYIALRYPAIDAIGADEFTGLIASRAAAYLIFGAVGGWAVQVLEGSLEKLELYDEIDDETGLYNARHLLQQTDLEMARARRYQTLFSAVTLEFPSAPLNDLRARRRRGLLRDLGRQVKDAARNVDHVVHANDGTSHRLVAILPETAREGAEVFRSRFEDKVHEFLDHHGASVDPSTVRASALTFPGDEEELDALRTEFQRIDSLLHR
jgi:GGDEF domain-containing protein